MNKALKTLLRVRAAEKKAAKQRFAEAERERIAQEERIGAIQGQIWSRMMATPNLAQVPMPMNWLRRNPSGSVGRSNSSGSSWSFIPEKPTVSKNEWRFEEQRSKNEWSSWRWREERRRSALGAEAQGRARA